VLGLAPASAAASPALLQVSGSPFSDSHGAMAVAFSPDDRYLAVANNDGTVTVYAVDTRAESLTEIAGSPFTAGLTGSVYQLAYSPNGAFLAIAADNGVFEFSVNTSTGALTDVTGSPYAVSSIVDSVQFSPSGALLAASDGTRNAVSIFTVNQSTGALTQVNASPFSTGSFPFGLAFSPSGRLLAVANSVSNDVAVFSINLFSGALTQVATGTLVSGAQPFGVAFSPSGGLLAVTDSGTSSYVSMFSVNTGTGALNAIPGSPFPTGPSPYSVAFSPNGQLLATADEGGGAGDLSAFAVDGSSSALTEVTGSPFATGNAPESVVFGSAGGLVAVANVKSGNLSVYALPAPTPVIVSPSPASVPTYAIGQSVKTTFSCADAQYGPGVTSCTDSNSADSPYGMLDTSAPGQHTYSVTALSADGESGRADLVYDVAAAPVVSLTRPASGQTYPLGATVVASYGCNDGAGGPGLATSDGCMGTVASGAPIDTSRVGLHSFSVTATSRDGQMATTTIQYTVGPSTSVSRLVSLRVAGASATATIGCTGQAGQRCTGELVAQTKTDSGIPRALANRPQPDTVPASARRAGVRPIKPVTVASASFSLAVGHTTTLHLNPNAAGRRLLAMSYRLSVAVGIVGEPLRISVTFAYKRFSVHNVPYTFSEPANTPYTLIQGLSVIDLPARAKVTVSCSGGGCSFSRRVFAHPGRGVGLESLVQGSQFAPSARLTITQTAPSYVGKVVVIHMRGYGVGPLLTELCLPPGYSHPAACV